MEENSLAIFNLLLREVKRRRQTDPDNPKLKEMEDVIPSVARMMVNRVMQPPYDTGETREQALMRYQKEFGDMSVDGLYKFYQRHMVEDEALM